jgi:hypothetical protein
MNRLSERASLSHVIRCSGRDCPLCPCHCYEIIKVRETSVFAAMQEPSLVRVLAQPRTIPGVGTRYLSVLQNTFQVSPAAR